LGHSGNDRHRHHLFSWRSVHPCGRGSRKTEQRPSMSLAVPFLPAESVTRSAEETFELAARIGASIRAPAVLLLSGDLGAGKTVSAKGLGAGLEIDPDEVTSPSFTLINEHHGRLRFYHVDLYRLESAAGQQLGLEEIFADAEAVVLIEW